MQIRNFTEANAALLPYVPLVAQLTGKDTTLDRIRPLMAKVNNPQDKLRIVHIAGTSGKTSTAYFIAALLKAGGQYVGLTVSPHVDSIAERVQLNGAPMGEVAFCQALGKFLDIVETLEQRPSYFELLYAFSLWVFAERGVDYAVIETGMGGLYDATNIADRADKLCIITDIGFDHMHILGHTLPEIAAQKAGIIHEHNPVIMYEQAPEITDVIQQWATEHQASVMLTNETTERKSCGANFVDGIPDYQQHNWLLAYRAYKFLSERDSLPALSDQALQLTQQVQVPARMDQRHVNDKTIIMDGAHNEQKMSTFLASFRHAYPNVKPAVLLAMKQGKEISDLGPLFAPLNPRVIVTTFNTSQDLPALSVEPAEIVTTFQSAGVSDIQAIQDQHQAYLQLLAGSEPVCIITGSFYLISQLREREKLQ